MSMAAYCRTCACRAEGPHGLRTFAFPSAAADSLLALVRSVYAGVSRGDGLPQNVCPQCARRLRSTRDFICKVRDAQDQLACMFPKDRNLRLVNAPQIPMLITSIKEEPIKHAIYTSKELLSSDEMVDASGDDKNDATDEEKNNDSHRADVVMCDDECTQDNETMTKPDYFVTFYDDKKELHLPVNFSSSDEDTIDDNNSDFTSEQEPVLKYEEVKIECLEIPNLLCNSDIEDVSNDDEGEQSKVSQEPTLQVKDEILHDTIQSSSEHSPAHDDEDNASFETHSFNDVTTTSFHLPKKSNDASLPVWKDYFHCKRCNKNTETVQELLDHSMEEHTSCMPFKCVKCSAVITSRHRFFQHMYKHDDTLTQCCEYCGEHFVSAFDAIWHKEIKHEVEKKNFQCRTCETGFDTNGELKCHQDTFIRRSKQPCVCDHCKQEFINKSKLIKHMERHYPSRHICKICNKTYLSKNYLQMHRNVHYPTVRHVCELCGKGFVYKSKYTTHLSTHSDAKPHKCDICQKRFKLLMHVKRHKLSHGPPLFVCDVCSKGFRFQNCLKIHRRVHTNEKPYSCDMCNKKFANWSNFNKHMKRIHDHNMAKSKVRNSTSPK